ncbi:glycosyltransferase family 2 protein, partial [Pontibacter rugosus]
GQIRSTALSNVLIVVVRYFVRAKYIDETLNAVLAQTFKNWECLVIDDGSTDDTHEVVKKHLIKDTRFRYIVRDKNRSKGACTCRNIGLELAQGKYIQFLDSDDLISSNKFEEQVRILENTTPDAIATCKWGSFTKSTKAPIVKPFRPTYFSTGNTLELLKVYGKYHTYLPSHAFLVAKEVINKAGGWNEKLTNNQDGEFFTRVLLKCSKIIFVPSAEVYYRKGADNRVSSLINEDKVKSLI